MQLTRYNSKEERSKYVMNNSQNEVRACSYDIATQQEVRESRAKGSRKEIQSEIA